MAELAAVASPDVPVGYPNWIERTLQITPGRDPLGLQTITIDRILPQLVPGVLALSRRARYFAFYPFLLQEYRKHRLDPTNRSLGEFIRAREFEYAVAVQLCLNGCGSIAAASVGSQRAGPAARPVEVGTPLQRTYSVESAMGGYGLYYRTPLIDLGVVAPSGTPLGDVPTPVDVLVGDQGEALGNAFRAAVADTDYYRGHMLGVEPIPADVLKALSVRACLCRLPEFPQEQATIRRTLLPSPERGPDDRQRRRSFAFFLSLIDRAPTVVDDEPAFRRAIWDAALEARGGTSARSDVAVRWGALVAKEYLQEAFSSIWSMTCRLGFATQRAEGFTTGELREFVRGRVTGRGQLPLGPGVAYAPDVPTSEFASDAVSAARAVDLEELRGWAQVQDSTAAGLALLFVLHARLPRPKEMPHGWGEIGTQRSDHQPGLLGLSHRLDEHLGTQPSLADTVEWLVSRYVLAAHESIAYSKLPNYTFRFRWERGRLRFFDPGYSRIDITDNRRDALSRLTEDTGLWRRVSGQPASVTEAGRALVAEVFG